MRYYKRNTTNLISVILSVFMLLGIMVLVPGIYGSVLSSYSVILGAFFILMPLVNALLQNFATLKAHDPQKHFFTLAFNESVAYEWIICISAIVLLFFLPNTDLRVLGWPTAIITVLVWIAVAAMTTVLSQKLTRVEFLTDTILVRGVNFFKSAGLSQKTTTGLGVYTYDEFNSFLINGEKMILKLQDGRGQVAVKLPKDKSEQVSSYLTAKGLVLERKG